MWGLRGSVGTSAVHELLGPVVKTRGTRWHPFLTILPQFNASGSDPRPLGGKLRLICVDGCDLFHGQADVI